MSILPNREALASLIPPGGIAVELGVAAGDFSVALLKGNRHFPILYSIDRWSDHHDDAEMELAKRRLAEFGRRSIVIRSTFEDALAAFPDRSLDFIYVDGYAHTGQEGGKTLEDWWPKLKPNGIMSGHDYHYRWPATIVAVEAFIRRHSLRISLTGETEEGLYPSWWTTKS